jgi:ATP-dependent protease ClpP protease subunit
MPAELLIYGVIGWDYGSRAEDVVRSLQDIPSNVDGLDLRLNSPGGDVDAGLAIHHYAKHWANERRVTSPSFKLRTIVDGYAYSATSIIMLCGDEIIMNPGTSAMIHKAWSFFAANADELDKYKDYLNKIDDGLASIYTGAMGKTKEDVLALMTAETYFTPEEAVAAKLVHKVGEDTSAASNRALHSTFNTVRSGQWSALMRAACMSRMTNQQAANKPKNTFDPLKDERFTFLRNLELDIACAG